MERVQRVENQKAKERVGPPSPMQAPKIGTALAAHQARPLRRCFFGALAPCTTHRWPTTDPSTHFLQVTPGPPKTEE